MNRCFERFKSFFRAQKKSDEVRRISSKDYHQIRREHFSGDKK